MMTKPKRQTPLYKLQARAEKAAQIPELIELVKVADSPSNAYELARQAGYSIEHCKACRTLATIQRDYPESYERALTEMQGGNTN